MMFLFCCMFALAIKAVVSAVVNVSASGAVVVVAVVYDTVTVSFSALRAVAAGNFDQMLLLQMLSMLLTSAVAVVHADPVCVVDVYCIMQENQ